MRDERGHEIKGAIAPCALYVDGDDGTPKSLDEVEIDGLKGWPCTPDKVLQQRKVDETGCRCPLVRLLPANANVVALGEIFLDDTEPEVIKTEAWQLYTMGMTAGERLDFSGRIRFYRSIRVQQMREEAKRRAKQQE